jgi:hypothetical protein
VKLSQLSPTTRLARLFATLFVVGLLYSLAMLARPDAHFLSRPFIEDAFYSLSAARSLGQGGGISIDGVTPTNGVQPLICFLYAPAFALAGDDLYAALRMTLALEIVLGTLAALALAWFALALLRPGAADDRARREIFWLIAGSVSVSYSLLVHLHNGLETALAAGFAFAATAFYIERIARRPDAPLAEFVRLGVLLGLGVLARIDLAILSATIAGWHLLSARRNGVRRTAPLAGAATIGIVSFLVSLPWWLYNLIGFGHVMPTSGLAQKDLITDRLASVDLVVRGVSNALLLVMHAPGDLDGIGAYAGLVLLAVVGAILLAVPPLRRWSLAALRHVARLIDLRQSMPLVAFLAIIVVYYTFFFGAPHFIPRYLTSLWLLLTLLLLVALYALWSTAPSAGLRRRAMIAAGALALAFSFWAQTRNFDDEGLYSNVMMYPADWIAAHTAPNDRIGMFQSGTTGFLFERVTNLDGKVNPRALEALRSGTLARFADSADFDYIIDLDFYTRHIFHDARMRQRYLPIDSLPYGFIVWRRMR